MTNEASTLVHDWPQFLSAGVLVMIRLSGLMLLASVPRLARSEGRVTEGRVTEGRVTRDSVPDSVSDSARVIVTLDPMSAQPLRELLRAAIGRQWRPLRVT